MPNMTNYVLGFMFSHDLKKVVLIRKVRPSWQARKLNGLGGHMETNELSFPAMVREFKEECGLDTSIDQWHRYASMRGNNFCVECFCCIGDTAQCKTLTDEQVGVFYISEVPPHRTDMVENVGWMIALAVDHLTDGRPTFTTIHYP